MVLFARLLIAFIGAITLLMLGHFFTSFLVRIESNSASLKISLSIKTFSKVYIQHKANQRCSIKNL